jgi:hypothetical protein
MEEKLIDFIKNEFTYDHNIEILIDTKLILSGKIYSFSLLSLQSYMVREFWKKYYYFKILYINLIILRKDGFY